MSSGQAEKLYYNKEFKLVHVNTNGTMTIVTPALDLGCRVHLRNHGYYALSHLWGAQTQETNKWRDHPIKDANGEEIKHVPMRPEKRTPLLNLLKSRPGYWWIDVFCAQVTTPLVIMGDIYRYCNACYAMIDCKPTSIRDYDNLASIYHTYADTFEFSKKFCIPLTDYVPNVLNKISALSANTTDTIWHAILDTFLPKSTKAYGVLDADSDIKALCDLLSCQWWKRVWTLQELFLPKSVFFVSETAESPQDRVCFSEIIAILSDLESILHELDEIRGPLTGLDLGAHNHELDNMRKSFLGLIPKGYNWELYESQKRLITSTLGTITSNKFYKFDMGLSGVPKNVKDLVKPIILESFSGSNRKCYERCDYVYGVIGLLEIDVPPIGNLQELWERFEEELLKLDVSGPIQPVDLSTVNSMQDVYSQFRLSLPSSVV